MSKEHIDKTYIQKLYDKNLGNRSLQGLLGAVLDGNIDIETFEESPIWKEVKVQHSTNLKKTRNEYQLYKKQKEISQLRMDQQYIQNEIMLLKDALDWEASQNNSISVESNIKMRGSDIFSQQFEDLTEYECHQKIHEFYDFLNLSGANSIIRNLNKALNKKGEPAEKYGIAVSIRYELKDQNPILWMNIFEPSFSMGYEHIFSTPLTFNTNKIFEFIYKYGYFENHLAEALFLTEDFESYEEFEDDKFPEL